MFAERSHKLATQRASHARGSWTRVGSKSAPPFPLRTLETIVDRDEYPSGGPDPATRRARAAGIRRGRLSSQGCEAETATRLLRPDPRP